MLSGNDRTPRQTVGAFYTAVRAGRLEEAVALTDPDVEIRPLLRPGRSVYLGHGGVGQLVHDLNKAYEGVEMEIGQIVVGNGPTVTMHVVLRPVNSPEPPRPAAVVHTFRNGLILAIESRTEPP